MRVVKKRRKGVEKRKDSEEEREKGEKQRRQSTFSQHDHEVLSEAAVLEASCRPFAKGAARIVAHLHVHVIAFIEHSLQLPNPRVVLRRSQLHGKDASQTQRKQEEKVNEKEKKKKEKKDTNFAREDISRRNERSDAAPTCGKVFTTQRFPA